MARLVKISVTVVISFFIIITLQNCTLYRISGTSLVSKDKLGGFSGFGQTMRDLSTGNDNKSSFGNGSISKEVFDSFITISTTSRLQGAIGSLTFRGKEFLNQEDHGRELQSASSFDGYGECLNPTEAGSQTDGKGDLSTSRLLGYSAEGNVLRTSTQMAYWLRGNQDYGHYTQNEGRGCGNNSNVKRAQNSVDLSNNVLFKRVTIGYSNIQNVIEYLVTFRITENHQSAVIEAVTGYLGPEFSTFFAFDPSSGQIAPLSSINAEQAFPVILSTNNQSYAMGIYSPDLPEASFSTVGYGRFNFFESNTIKWNAVYRRGNTPAADYSYRQYIIVGSVSEVQASMNQLNFIFHPKPEVAPKINIAARFEPMLPPAPAGQQNNFRFYKKESGEHFITINKDEGLNNGFTLDGIAFTSFADSLELANTLIIYRCLDKGLKHFLSTDLKCEGQNQEGNLGRIYSTQISDSTPLYRFFLQSSGDHLITTNYQEGISAGYSYEGVLGYVP